MQKLRSTFKRSYSPVAVEMKSQDSLEVPKQVRSASFDDIEFSKQKTKDRGEQFLKVPGVRNQRSKSFDSSTPASYPRREPDGSLDVPKLKNRRRSSGSDKSSSGCIHCFLLDEYAKECEENREGPLRPYRLSYSSSESLSQDEDSDDSSGDELPGGGCSRLPLDLGVSSDVDTFIGAELNLGGITVILSPNSPSNEQTALCFPPVLVADVSCEEVYHGTESSLPSKSSSLDDDGATMSPVSSKGDVEDSLAGETVLSLQVPVLPKQQRSASVDSSFTKVPNVDGMGLSPDGNFLLEVPKAQRSRSVDIVLPTEELSSYRAMPLRTSPRSTVPKAIQQPPPPETTPGFADIGEQRPARSVSSPDWTEIAVHGDHLWVATSASGDLCYLVDHNICSRQGPRYKCAACKVIFHMGCISQVQGDKKYQCKPTFHDVGIRQYREQTVIEHHWVHRKNQKGKCRRCSKSFQSKLSFGNSKEIVAVICSWCKTAYHSREPCFTKECLKDGCDLGVHAGIIVPPSWIIKLPRKGSFKSSLRKPPKKRASSKRKSKKEDNQQKTFVIKPIPSNNMKPLLVFINPKSGGNQGSKLMQKFQWLLNPRQVFELTQGGPKVGLELFKKVPNLRILACGGDGTAGWVLSELDAFNISPQPPVAVLPLGTGNDLARSLGWGGGYTDEPISKILTNIEEGEVIQLDRWDVKVEKHPYPDPTNTEVGKSQLPLSVVNNYFSLGTDAYIALEFHEAREAHPEKFNSRLKNKMFYGQAGGKDLLQRKWRDLSDYVTLECDGRDLTPKLKELKVHTILFLNIPSYGGGTRPWNSQSSGFEAQRTDDGLIEVIGLTTYQLAILQAGGHGTSLAQCRHAKLATTRTIPMQVDGEPCRLAPSLIEIKLRNKVNMVAKAKKHGAPLNMQAMFDKLQVKVFCISMKDYENFHYNKDKLRQFAVLVCEINVPQNADLEYVRTLINNNVEEPSIEEPDTSTETLKVNLNREWCFLDSVTAERCFRIDRAQEHLHYITDVSADELYILNPEHGVGSLTSSPDSHETEPVSKEPSVDDSSSSSPPPVPLISSSLKQKENGSTISVERSDSGVSMASKEKQRISQSDDDEHEDNPKLDTRPELGKLYRPKTPVCRASMLKSLHNASIHVKQLGPEFYDPSHLLEKNSEEVIRAAKIGDLASLRDSTSKGFSLLSIDQYGMTALHHAAENGHKLIVQYLIANAPSTILNMVDNVSGQTALHKAAATRRRTICCSLVAAGASLTITDNQGMTPKLLAHRARDEDLTAYFENREHFQLINLKDQETTV